MNVENFEEVVAVKETEAALLCEIGGEAVWVPKSQIDDDSEVWKQGDEGKLVVNSWWAEKAGLT